MLIFTALRFIRDVIVDANALRREAQKRYPYLVE